MGPHSDLFAGNRKYLSSRNADPIEDNDILFYNGGISGSKDNVAENVIKTNRQCKPVATIEPGLSSTPKILGLVCISKIRP